MSRLIRSSGLLVALVVLLLTAGCATNSTAGPAAQPTPATRGAFPLTITDDAGRSVTLTKAPQRIISLASSNTELIYAIGLQDKLVGVDDYSDYPAEAKTKEKVGGFSKPNLEKIVALTPDVLLLTNIHVKTVLPELESRGLKAIVIQPETLDKVPGNVRLLGKLGDKQDAAEKVAADIAKRIDAVANKAKTATSKTRVFFELDPELITVGPGTFLNDMIVKVGGENIAADAKTAWPKLSPEAIVTKDPQVIILSDHGSERGGVTADMVKARPGWSVISAVKAGKVELLPDQDLTNRPGPRAVEGLEYLARTLHPELFPAR
ncbi:MAG: ABC transporter substrate-binding protein [Chloroflexota bacterium]